MKGHSGGCPEGRCSPGLEYQKEGREERWNPVSCTLPPWVWEARQGVGDLYVTAKLCDPQAGLRISLSSAVSP